MSVLLERISKRGLASLVGRIKQPLETVTYHLTAGRLWCSVCADFHYLTHFSLNARRWSGRDSRCKRFYSVRYYRQKGQSQ